MIINMAIALKSLNEERKCKELLEKHDWSAVSNLFKMAEKILNDDFENAVSFLRKAYASEEISKENMIEWPLFYKFRGTIEFKKIYAELFPSIEVKTQVEPSQIVEVAQAEAEVHAEAAQLEEEAEAEARAEAAQIKEVAEAEVRAEAAQIKEEAEAGSDVVKTSN